MMIKVRAPDNIFTEEIEGMLVPHVAIIHSLSNAFCERFYIVPKEVP
jgi:hypothetical protein